jgi:putative inorganic carbon (hco3(-)) transporter
MFQNLIERRPLGNGGLIVFLIGLTTLIMGLIAINQATLATGIGLGLLIILAILAKPNLATLLVVFILYTNAAVIVVHFHNVPSLIGGSLPALLVFPLASYVIVRREKLVISPILLPIFLFFAVQVAGTLFADYRYEATNNLITFILEGLGIFFLITNVVRTPRMMRQVTWALLIAGAFIGGLSLYQQLTRTFHDNYWGFAQVSFAQVNTGIETINGAITEPRLAGQIGEKNRYAQVMLMLVPIGIFRFWGEKKLLMRVLAALATGLIAVGSALAYSRGAAVGFVLMLLIMVFMRYIKIWQVGVIVVLLAVVLAAVPTYATRLTSLQTLAASFSDNTETGVANADGATLGRLTEMGAAGLVFLDHPILGVGPGLFPLYYQEYADLIGLRTQNSDRQAHDLYVSIAAETGGLGLACFLLVIYITFRGLARARKRWLDEEPEIANMATAYMLSIVTYLTTGIFLHFAFIRYFWLIMALAAAVIYIAEQRALADRKSIQDELAPSPVGREGLVAAAGTRSY